MNEHINTNNEIDGELLSAYLDDELTASERVMVKQAIENSSQLRESLQELTVLSEEIQSLSVEFHSDEQQMIGTVITKIRDRNLSVHGQTPFSDVKIPAVGKDWKRRLKTPVLVALAASVLAVLTLQFMTNEPTMTLVQTNGVDTASPVENSFPAADIALESEAVAENDTPMGAMAGGLKSFADAPSLPNSKDSRDNAPRLAVNSAANVNDNMSDFTNKQQLMNGQAEEKTDVANITYHIQVNEKDLPALLALLTTHQNLAQNIRWKKEAPLARNGQPEGGARPAEEPQQRVASSKTMENLVQKSTSNQIVMFRSNGSQLTTLVRMLQKNSAFTLSMNHLQRGALESQRGAKNKDTFEAENQNLSEAAILSDTIFSIQIIATP